MFVPQRAARARQQASLTVQDAADKTGRTAEVIRAVEAGQLRPSLPLLARMGIAYRVRITTFFTEPDPDLAAYEQSTTPSELGPELDAWLRAAMDAMPQMDDDTARHVSAVLFHD